MCLFNEGPVTLRVCGEAFAYEVIDAAILKFGNLFLDLFL